MRGLAVVAAVTVAMVCANGASAQERQRGPNQGYKSMEGYYGNSMVFHDKDGKMNAFIYYSPDYTFKEWRTGNWTNGTWTINNGQDNSTICQTRDQDGKPWTNCHPFAANMKVGDRWISSEGPGGSAKGQGTTMIGTGATAPAGTPWLSLEKGLMAAPAGKGG